MPALFHTGQTGIGAGLPGGYRIKLRYSDPMLLDDVAADFPELTIVMAHPAVPWVDAQIAIASHKSNVYIDLSGWSPKYFPPQLVHAAGRQLRTKVLFGTDYPYIKMDRWRRDFEALDIDPAVVPLIYKDNALRVLGGMARLRPGWLVVLCAAVLAVSVWLPWLTSRADGGGRANAIGGIVGNMPVPPPGFGVGQLIVLLASTLIVAGAMAARGLFGRLASTAALAISVLLVVLTMWYYRLYVYSPVSAGYGLYVGAAAAVFAVLLSVWAMIAAWSAVSRVS